MILADVQGEKHIGPIQGLLYRLVESQEQVATLGYVDTLDEQALLEQMLDDTKPPYPDGLTGLHYLLKTPFRYPPLKWGSRFGSTHEPSIFYGGRSASTTLAESAYYRFVFWDSIDAAPVANKIRTKHSMFTVRYKADRGVRLHCPPFEAFHAQLTHRSSYTCTQELGADMRKAGIEAFEYQSARDPEGGTCVGLFSRSALASKRPIDMSELLCEVSADEVSFKQLGSSEVTTFQVRDFLIDGALPHPA